MDRFPDRDIKRHAETRKRFQSLYSMTSLVNYESYVDEIFGRRLDDRHGDVIGDITYSQCFGFLDKGQDVAGLLKALRRAVVYSTLVGIYAKLRPYLSAVMARLNIGGAAGRNYLMQFVEQRIKQRKTQRTWRRRARRTRGATRLSREADGERIRRR